MICDCYSLTSLKQAVNYLLENCFIKVNSQFFWQAIRVLMILPHSLPKSFYFIKNLDGQVKWKMSLYKKIWAWVLIYG